jgi:hypothetical protein
MKFTNLKTNSNLGFVNDMTVDVSFEGKNQKVRLKFSTGFETVATKQGSEGDIDIYTYSGRKEGEIHYLHVRKDNGVFYFQTVQTGTTPGGSTFVAKLPTMDDVDAFAKEKGWV